jgi:hypothetical protein
MQITDITGLNVCSVNAAAQQAVNTEGLKASYSAAINSLVPAAAGATDLFTIYGSASKTVRITRISMVGTATALTDVPVSLIKRSAVNTTGTSTSQTAVPHDSNNAAATGTVLAYTVNPGGLGATVGTVRASVLALTAATGAPSPTIWDFTIRNTQGIVLRGVAQGLAINLNSTAITAGSVNIDIEWSEE